MRALTTKKSIQKNENFILLGASALGGLTGYYISKKVNHEHTPYVFLGEIIAVIAAKLYIDSSIKK